MRELQASNRLLCDALTAALERLQALSLQQAQTLDRIVQSRFDLPVVASTREIVPNAPSLPASQLGDLIGMDDSGEFVRAAVSTFGPVGL